MKKGLLKKIMVMAIASTMAITSVGCGKSDVNTTGEKKTQLEQIKEDGKLVVGTSADYPPYEFHANIDGQDKIVGFDIDIAQAFADDLGVELEIKDMKFDGLLIALQADKVDMVFSGMTPTEERKQNADFSDIYYEAKHGFMLRKGEETNIKSFDDLKGKKIGVQKGSIQEGIAKENFEAENVKSLSKIPELVLDLKNNKVDAILVEEGVAQITCNNNNDVAMADFEITDETGGNAIALKKGEKELQDAINKTISKLKEENKIEKFVSDANDLAAEQQ